MGRKFYGQYCPLSKGAEVFAERWVPQIMYELLCGSTRFNEIRRGIPRISPALLTARLRHLEHYRILQRRRKGRSVEYELTTAGRALGPLVERLALWGKDHARTDVTMDELDANRLMWDIRRRIGTPDEARRVVIHFYLTSPSDGRLLRYWLVFDRGEVDLCFVDPGHEDDLIVRGRVDSLAAVWLGDVPLRRAIERRIIRFDGPPELCRRFERSFGVSMVAEMRNRAAGTVH